MDTKFTPGPWTIEDNRDLNGAFWIGVDHPMWGFISHGEIRSGCDEADELGDMEANAHMAAAAPELYEADDDAADFLLANYGSITDPDNREGWSCPDAYAVYRKLAAATSKARGQP